MDRVILKYVVTSSLRRVVKQWYRCIAIEIRSCTSGVHVGCQWFQIRALSTILIKWAVLTAYACKF
jgi:hypothetical protein